jgi:hypothetical protein
MPDARPSPQASLPRLPAFLFAPAFAPAFAAFAVVAATGCSGAPTFMLPGADGVGVGLDTDSERSSDAGTGADSSLSAASAPAAGHSDGFAPDGGAAAPPAVDASLDASAVRSIDASTLIDAAAVASLDAGAEPFDGPAADGGPDASAILCPVTFQVDAAFVDGFVFQNVVLSGDAPALGARDPSLAVVMTSIAGQPGEWSAVVSLVDASTVHFEFGMSGGGGADLTWEGSAATSPRSLVVDCSDGAAVTYVGQYNQGSDD